ncbi:MAG TPA: transglutaminase-like domain-containing protein, partial [Pyrinomonadaceae bacterium]|nr:transglutaminase-like domain-containing protein [Pyrinomonadaceae bacterium]
RRPTGQVLMTLNEAISDGFAYDRRTAPGTQSPSTTLELRKGTCRDFAVLMIEAARSLGFAARFITGYIYVPDRDGPTWLGGEPPMPGARFTSPVPAGSSSIRPMESSETEI